MSSTTTRDLARLLDRLGRGEDAARRAILERAHHRLVKIAAAIFQADFRDLHGRHTVDSVVGDLWIRMERALAATQPSTVQGFFGLVFLNVRRILIDLARQQRRDDARRRDVPFEMGESGTPKEFDVADTTHDPVRLALLTELHQQIQILPIDERSVFEIRYYGGYSQAEIAEILRLHPRTVSRLWHAATSRLAAWLGGFEDVF